MLQTQNLILQRDMQVQTGHTKQQGEEAEIDAARKDTAAFAVLYNRYYDAIFRFVYRRLNSKDLAADMTGQVFLKAMTHLSSFRYRGLPFVCWLYRIAANELKHLFRDNARHRTINAETAGLHQMAEEMEENIPDAWHMEMLALLPELPEDELTLIEMRYFEKRPFKEIGEIMDITENNAKVKLYRTLEKLKKQIIAAQKSTNPKIR